jgi:multicomponent Na+:H+ antiporter subunit D
LQLLLFSGLAFFVMLKWLQRTLTITLDFDWLYRAFLVAAVDRIEGWVTAMRDRITAKLRDGSARVSGAVRRLHDSQGIFAPTCNRAPWRC